MNALIHATALVVAMSTLVIAPDPAAFPELQIDNLLPALVAGLKRTLSDAYSARDLTVCDPIKVKFEGGRPVSWSLQFALNSKSETGGYSGLKSYGAIFKKGRAKMIFPSGLTGKGGLDQVINRAIMKQITPCRSIPQTQLQALLEATPAL